MQRSIHNIIKAETDHHTSRLSFFCASSFSCSPLSSCSVSFSLSLSLSLSSGSAGGFKEQPVHCPVWGEQRGGDGSLSQHQKGSLPWNLQSAGVGAPSGGWEQVLQYMAKTIQLRILKSWANFYESDFIKRERFFLERVSGCDFFFPPRVFSVCENGWRCCLINRDRKMPTDYIRNGVLYVTEK